MVNDVAAELEAAVDKVLASKARKKLVVAGPGAGKTTLFRKLLDGTPGTADQRLVVTFINNLKNDLEGSLGDAARVFTLHGYCQHLLHQHGGLRNGLSADFKCYPGLISLIKKDWVWLQESKAPEFVSLMRDLACSAEQDSFYLDRANYYDAVDFDDSVYRTRQQLVADMPRNAADVKDIEICKFLVGMTRTKKKCSILTTGRFGQDFKRPSEFLAWIKADRFEKKKIDAAYWKENE